MTVTQKDGHFAVSRIGNMTKKGRFKGFRYRKYQKNTIANFTGNIWIERFDKLDRFPIL